MTTRKPIFKAQISKKGIKGTIFGLLFGISFGAGYQEYYGVGTWHSAETPAENFSVCFTPPRGCGSLIAQRIQEAKLSIYAQAYSLSNYAIINQLILAKSRGVNVRLVLDNSNFSENKSTVTDLRNAGIEVVKDSISGIAHNKIIIIDEAQVITGSFNFSEAADKRNAENVMFIQDKNIASFYLANWHKRYNEAIK
ncbi:MAG: phospholipase D-like domain-containing protein [Rickettsiaceae bacterium]|nr:phospholipase D-like domain-containing protein [Rickettsiaceae bacterium]